MLSLWVTAGRFPFQFTLSSWAVNKLEPNERMMLEHYELMCLSWEPKKKETEAADTCPGRVKGP